MCDLLGAVATFRSGVSEQPLPRALKPPEAQMRTSGLHRQGFPLCERNPEEQVYSTYAYFTGFEWG